MFKVEIKNLKTKARIGITPKERKNFQKLLVTIYVLNTQFTLVKN